PYSISGHVTADKAFVDATLTVTISNGAAQASVVSSNASFDNFAWGLSGWPSWVTNLATPLVRGAVESEIQKTVANVVPPELDKVLSGALGQPIVHQLLGTQASLDLLPTSVGFDTAGESLAFDANVSVAPLAG